MISALKYSFEKKQTVAAVAVTAALLIAVLPLFASAQAIPTLPRLEFARTETNTETGVQKIVSNIAKVAGTVIIALSVLMILWSAFQFLTAGAGTDVAKARTTLIYALVGVVVALLAFALPALVARLFA